MLDSSLFDAWLAWPGIVIGLLLAFGSLEFVGRFEEKGWQLAGTIVPIAYIAWSLWLVTAGVVLILNQMSPDALASGKLPRGAAFSVTARREPREQLRCIRFRQQSVASAYPWSTLVLRCFHASHGVS